MKVCKVKGCKRKYCAKGYCRKHYLNYKKYGNPLIKKSRGAQKGKDNPNWKNGRSSDGEGYIYILMPDHPFAHKTGYVLEHRLIIEKEIGRYLKPEEACHHINGIKNDNRPENLMAFINNPTHRRFHGNPNSVNPKDIIFP